MRISAIILALAAVAGCGSSGSTSDLSGVIDADTAPYAILDLSSGAITWSTTLSADAAELRAGRMAFRRVAVGSGEALVGVFELTQAQWQALYGAAPPTWPWQAVPDAICDPTSSHGGDRPAYNLDRETLITVLAAFSGVGGARLALPSEAEWTAACGAATGWSWGDTATQAQLEAAAVVRETALTPARISAGGIDNGGPAPVGSLAANARGFYDMHGNVWELVGDGSRARGGSWRDAAWQSRSESAVGAAEGFHAELDHALVGARLVLKP